jgi:ribosomal protein L37AE/L43A
VGVIRFLRRGERREKPRPPRRLRPVCPICERPMERRASTVWMCPDFPRCPGSIAAD